MHDVHSKWTLPLKGSFIFVNSCKWRFCLKMWKGVRWAMSATVSRHWGVVAIVLATLGSVKMGSGSLGLSQSIQKDLKDLPVQSSLNIHLYVISVIPLTFGRFYPLWNPSIRLCSTFKVWTCWLQAGGGEYIHSFDLFCVFSAVAAHIGFDRSTYLVARLPGM